MKIFGRNSSVYKAKQKIKQKDSFDGFVEISNSRSFYCRFKSQQDLEDLLGDKKFTEENQCQFHWVSRIPLDLNSTSKIVLVTFFKEKISLTVDGLFKEFSKFGQVLKVVIFKKKNMQAFVEFSQREEAEKMKAALHNKQVKDQFFLKINFTQKTHLRIKPHSKFEKAFN